MTVTVKESLPISLPVDQVTVLNILISKDTLLVSSINELGSNNGNCFQG